MRELVTESGERRFRVQQDLLASQSNHLKILTDTIPPGLISAPRELDIGLWDTDTMGRFVEYIYTGDYQSPDPVPLATPVTSPQTSSSGSSAALPGSLPTLQTRGAADRSGPPRPLTPLSKCFPAGPDPPQKLSAAAIFAGKDFDPLKHDFEEVFLAHAKLYAMALKLEVEPLCTLTLQRLLKTLINIGTVQSSSSVPGNFAELARYIYSHTNNEEDPLRRIISQFAALNITSLQTKEMKELIGEGGDFATDLAEKTSRIIAVWSPWASVVADFERIFKK